MSHIVLGNVSAEVYDSNQAKTIKLITTVPAGSLLVAFAGGTDQIGLDAISDSKGNVWDQKFRQASLAERHLMGLIGWSLLSTQMTPSDTVTIALDGVPTQNWYAVLRAYRGLGIPITIQPSFTGFGTSLYVVDVVHDETGRVVGMMTVRNAQTGSVWTGGAVQVEAFYDAADDDTYSIGEKPVTGASTFQLKYDPPGGNDGLLIGAAFPEIPYSTRRPKIICHMG